MPPPAKILHVFAPAEQEASRVLLPWRKRQFSYITSTGIGKWDTNIDRPDQRGKKKYKIFLQNSFLLKITVLQILRQLSKQRFVLALICNAIYYF